MWDVRPGCASAAASASERLSGHVKQLLPLADGRITCICATGGVHVWHPDTGARVDCVGDAAYVYCASDKALVQLPHGRLAASGSGCVKLWDAATGECSATLKDEHCSYDPTGLCVLADGRLACGKGSKLGCVWDTGTGALVALLGHNMHRLVGLPDGHQYCIVVVREAVADGRWREVCAGAGERGRYGTARLASPQPPLRCHLSVAAFAL